MIDWLYINWPTLSGTLATIAVGVATVVVTIRLARPRMSLIYEIVVGAAATFRDYGVKPLPALSPLEVGHDYIVAITLLNAGRRTISSASFDAFRPISVEIGSVSQAERERFERRHEKKPLPAVVARELGTWYLVLGTWYLVLGTWYLHIGPGLLRSRESVRYEIGFSGNGRPALFSHYLVDVPVRESRSWLNQFARGVPFGLVAVALLCLVLYMQVNHFAVSWRAALGKVLNFSTWVDEWESSALVSFSWVGFLTRIGRHTVPCRVSGCRGQDHRDRERCARIQGMAEGPSCRTDEG